MGAACCAQGNDKTDTYTVVDSVDAKTAPPEQQPEEEEQQPAPEPVEEPPPPEPLKVVLVFVLPDGSEKAFDCRSRPLGVGFGKTMPMVVRSIKPGGAGEEMKIQAGWQLKSVSGELVGDKNAEDAMNLLVKTFDQLPSD